MLEFHSTSRSTCRGGKNLFVRLSQLKSTAIDGTDRRLAVRRTGISEKIRPGDAAAASEGR